MSDASDSFPQFMNYGDDNYNCGAHQPDVSNFDLSVYGKASADFYASSKFLGCAPGPWPTGEDAATLLSAAASLNPARGRVNPQLGTIELSGAAAWRLYGAFIDGIGFPNHVRE